MRNVSGPAAGSRGEAEPAGMAETQSAERLRGGGGTGMGGRGVGIGMIVSCIIGLLLSSSERRGLAARDL